MTCEPKSVLTVLVRAITVGMTPKTASKAVVFGGLLTDIYHRYIPVGWI
jgi:hypothetical protein